MNKRKKRQKNVEKKRKIERSDRDKRKKERDLKVDLSSGAPVLKAFRKLWQDLMTSPIHLDSLLAKQTPKQKSLLAQIVPSILMQPVSLAEHFGVGVAPGEPWSLSPDERAKWRPAELIAERMIEDLAHGFPKVKALPQDYPPEMREEWEREWGESAARGLRETLAHPAPLTMRASVRATPKEIVAELKAGSTLPVSVRETVCSPVGVELGGYVPVMRWKRVEEGDLEIQDEGSQLMALFALQPEAVAGVLHAVPGGESKKRAPELAKPAALTVVDACAGAGGKTLALADLLRGKGRVYGYDVFESKIAALKRRAKKARLNNVQGVLLKEGSEDETLAKFLGSADVVLVDSPCSGWGVLRRNPDIKWRQGRDALDRLPEVQFRVLSLYSRLVKPGGRLVYGLCTFRKEETEAVVKRFLSSHPGFKAVAGGYFGPGPSDGFYMQAFERCS